MDRRELLKAVPAAALIDLTKMASADETQKAVYELRVYHVVSGKLDELLGRFRDHTLAIFARHALKTVAFWVPTDEPQKATMLVYILRHPSREAADANWKAFREDPEWVRVKTESEAKGPLVEKVDSTFMALTDFSPKLS